MDTKMVQPCPECKRGLALIEPGQFVYCPGCGWKQPEEERRGVIKFSELTLQINTTPGVMRVGRQCYLSLPVIRDFQARMIELGKEITRAKWQASIEGEPSADEGNPSSAVEFLEQKRQRTAERQAEERRGRIKPWDKPGKRFR